MTIEFSETQNEVRDAAREFSRRYIEPEAAEIDSSGCIPMHLLTRFRNSGFLGAALPREWGGGGLDSVAYGLVTEEIAKGCSSLRSLMTVHNMAAQAILRFAEPKTREAWLPDLCTGRKICAFALTESEGGSMMRGLKVLAEDSGTEYRLSGTKRWVTFGQLADCYLVFSTTAAGQIATIVEARSGGIKIRPIKDALGTRGSMLADISFEATPIAKDHLIGRVGAAISMVANVALDHGRHSVAWGCTGIIQGCLDASVIHTNVRNESGVKLREHQLVRRQLADMLVGHTVARSLCLRSAAMRDAADPRAIMETSIAKYVAASTALEVSAAAIQLHGANGCSSRYPVERYHRDAMVMSIIEGTKEMHQLSISNYAFQRPYEV